MRKINNGQKFHNNSNNTIYSLNYKFDSICSAGKFSGTALDLIKKYNELAKEAHSNGDYVEMEVFRQYAEHYRKIVTEINERKNQNRENRQANAAENTEQSPETVTEAQQQSVNNGLVETQAAESSAPATERADNETANKSVTKTTRRHRGFTVVEVSATQENLPEDNSEQAKSEETTSKPRRGRRPLMKKNTSPVSETSEASNA
ncbi:MAG: DUF4167 domain-containing protein [Alphaproteobacteria bacterium]|nr:DUF4167 domain-containing protein [Alphaproteobacteria bacterium]